MPDREIKNVRDLILYQYAKILAKEALGPEYKRKGHDLVKTGYRDLKHNQIRWESILKEGADPEGMEKHCVYCGSKGKTELLSVVTEIPGVSEECSGCDIIEGVQSRVWTCGKCSRKRGKKGLYRFLREQHPDQPKFYDKINPDLEKAYLKAVYHCHQCRGTLLSSDPDGDGKLTVLDLDLSG